MLKKKGAFICLKGITKKLSRDKVQSSLFAKSDLFYRNFEPQQTDRCVCQWQRHLLGNMVKGHVV